MHDVTDAIYSISTDDISVLQCLGQNFALMQIRYVLARLIQALETPSDTSGRATQPRTIALVRPGTSAGAPPPETWSTLEGRGQDEQVWVTSDLTLQVKVSRRLHLEVLVSQLSCYASPREDYGQGFWQHGI
jgi:hypothetical protein